MAENHYQEQTAIHFPLGKSDKRSLYVRKTNTESRENKGTERENQGVGWDMSLPLKIFLTLDGNGRLFPQTSA